MTTDSYNLDGPAKEVLDGLPCEQDRLLCALANQAYYDQENEQFIPRRPGESDYDYAQRPKRTLDLTRSVIDALCSHQYFPPPARKVEGKASVDAYLQGIYADQLIDARWQQAERLAATNTVCGIQVVATGDDARPIKFNLWGGEELAVWTDPEDAAKPWAVCVIDRQDCQTRYKLWDDKEVRVYVTKKVGRDQTSGGRTATEISREPHDYGCLPFVFVHYELPDRKFWTGSPGETLRKANARIDIRLSELDEAIERYNLRPAVLAWGVDAAWRPILRPGSVNHVPTKGTRELGGATASGPDPHIDIHQPAIDVASVWSDVSEYMYAKMEGCGVPRSAVRMEQSGLASGIAIVAEQAPLLIRAQNRRGVFRVYENELAKVVLACAGNHYGKPELTAAAKDVRLSLLWPEPFIPIPDAARDQLDMSAIDMGIKSAVDVAMERYGMTREQAIIRLKQVAKDNELMASIHPKPAAADGGDEGQIAKGGDTDPGPSDVAESDKPDESKSEEQ